MFGHLQVYSCFSFQNSTILIKDLVAEAKNKNIEALAICDDNNMFGALEFSEECLKHGIKPIFGLEASVRIEGEIYPLFLYAIDDIGYFDLVKICCDINLNDDKSIDLDSLSLYKEHLYIMSGSEKGIVERLVAKEMEEEAIRYLSLFKNIFGDHYCVMIQNHHLKLQKTRNERLISLARYLKIKVVCSNEVRYLRKQDALAVDLMQASSEGRKLERNHDIKTDQKYLKTKEEMEELFDKDILNDTYDIIKHCKASIPMNDKHLPAYPVPKGGQAKDYLKQLCYVGLRKRFNGEEVLPSYYDRLNYELEVIHNMGFDDYFLIVFDYVRYAKMNKIQVGPGRGSAAGSLVAYVLGITNIDPLKYDLLFERFLNPERISMPDIDIDFQDDRRDEVVNYVIDKYGSDHVAQIVTFTTYGPRVAIKEMGKVMNIPLPKLELIAKMIPTDKKNKKTITQMYGSSASFLTLVNQEPALKKIIGACSIIEHLPKNISTHAAGVILSKKPLRDVIPLVIGPTSTLMAQYSKDYVEKIGLLKMDFLGLKNLTIIDYICSDLAKDGIELKMNELPLDNELTYELIGRAETFGIFQLESQGMRNLLIRMKPYCFDDIVAAIALYRPGPMENIPLYLRRRGKEEEITYPLNELEPILSSTYGVMIYQEQIMMISQVLAGFSLGKADILRKAISKKEAVLMKSMRDDFIQGCIKNGYSEDKAVEVFDLIEKFANYGFNKSHSVAYGYVAYQLAYLKANYPLYFFAAILSNELSSESTKIHCIQECRNYNVKVLSPSINKSYKRFMVEDGHIRYSLLAIKNVGIAAYQAIVEEREQNGDYKDFYDFMMRNDESRISKKVVESLIDAGTFDEFGVGRKELLMNYDRIREYCHLKKTLGIDEMPIFLLIHEDEKEKLEREKEVLGLYLSMHPIEFIKNKLKYKYIHISSLHNYITRSVNIVMQIQRVKVIVDKNGRDMCFIEGIDETGSVEGVIFSSVYKNVGTMIKKGNIVLMNGKVNFKDKLSFVVDKVMVINE